MNSIKGRLPKWRGGGSRKKSRSPRCCIHPRAASTSITSSLANHASHSSLSPSDMSWRILAEQLPCCRRSIHSSPQCGRSSSFASPEPSLRDHDDPSKNIIVSSYLSNETSTRHDILQQNNQQQITTTKTPLSNNTTCHQSEGPLVAPNTPFPPPLPNPTYSFRGRSLPPNLLAFNSSSGKRRFLESLQTNNAEAYFPLSQQFLNQMDPAFCGISTLILILNALAMDPNVRWRGGWRWYGDEAMLLERCCLEAERVAREGITMEQYCGLARCQGVGVVMKRPMLVDVETNEDENGEGHTERSGNDDASENEEEFGMQQFRRDVIEAVRHPPRTHWDDAAESNSEPPQATTATTTRSQNEPASSAGGYFLVTSFARHALGQTGDGHFSPIAAYHPPTDSCLVLDVARFKYAPYWVSVSEMYDAMTPCDESTGRSRGWILMYPPPPSQSLSSKRHGKKTNDEPMSKEELEGKRPAACVPLAGSGERICPVEKIKVDFCSVGK
eukprot:CAMPEP_0201682130 /NCGR_PEP_ID=MMETSP0494-20130426/51465_1 /ASSEMBLY_ACC=CAM_ASM_000839 /TAXON_ID=420259 /ORGANISM="Thalassiosira gravida, Strain GMp14c1" /LENGTH=499 /DNA_ID=CAMNT_0048165887 /DNA_START=70 /DNA_END=1566 /DNA_ORIENTATION=-